MNSQKNLDSGEKGEWIYAETIDEACKNSDAILILTEWEEFKDLDFKKLRNSMRSPAWLFDTRCITDCNLASSAGFKVWRLGKGVVEDY